jgi:hypothetical protein
MGKYDKGKRIRQWVDHYEDLAIAKKMRSQWP